MRILVMGGAGFIGKAICRYLLRMGHEVRILDLAPTCPSELEGATYIAGSFLDPATLAEAVADRDCCFHLVSTTLPASSNQNIMFDLETNLRGGVAFLEAATKARISRVVFLSSGGTVYGVPATVPITEDHPLRPICAYGVSKAAMENYLHLFFQLRSLDYRILRLANPYGPGQSPVTGQGVISAFLDRVSRRVPIEIWGDGRIVRDFIFIDDVVDAICTAALTQTDVKIFNVGSGKGCSILDLLRLVERVVERKAVIEFKPARGFDVPVNVLDSSSIRNVLGWAPKYSLHEGLGRTWAHQFEVTSQTPARAQVRVGSEL